MNKVNLFKLKTYNNSLKTCLTHQWNMMIGLSFFILEVVFLTLYVFNFWFSCNLTNLVLLSFILILTLAFVLLTTFELNVFNLIVYPLLRGKPLIVFRELISLNNPNYPPGISFGLKHIQFPIIKELKLNFWGNLEIKSDCLTGCLNKIHNETILTIPFSLANYQTQMLLINTIKNNCANLKLNARLVKFMVKPPLAGAKRMHGVTLIILLYLLFDINFTTFNYLELLKNYYYATNLTEIHGIPVSVFFQRACLIEKCNPQYSYIWSRFFASNHIINNLAYLKSKYYFQTRDYDNCLTVLKNGLIRDAKNFRLELAYARYLSALKHYDLADKSLIKSSELHKTKLLPKFYRFSMAINLNDKVKADKLYADFNQSLTKEVFGDKPKWPPFSGSFLDDIWYQEDFNYIFEMLLNKGYEVRN